MVVKKVNIFLETRTTQSQKDRREIQQLALTKFLLTFEFPLANNQWLDANRSKKKIAKIDVCQKQFNKSIEIKKSQSQKIRRKHNQLHKASIFRSYFEPTTRG